MTPTRTQVIFAKEVVANVKIVALAIILTAISAFVYYELHKPDYYTESEIQKFNQSCKMLVNYAKLNSKIYSYMLQDVDQGFELRHGRIKIPAQYLPMDYYQADDDWSGVHYGALSRKSPYFNRVNDMSRDYHMLDRAIKGAELINNDVEVFFASDLKWFTKNLLLALVLSLVSLRYLIQAVRWIYKTSKIQI